MTATALAQGEFAEGRQPVTNSCDPDRQGDPAPDGSPHPTLIHATCPCTVWPGSKLAVALGCECECHR